MAELSAFRKLVIHIATLKMVPEGTNFYDGVMVLKSLELHNMLKISQEEANQMIELVKSSPDNPYGDDKDLIAAEILRRIENKGD